MQFVPATRMALFVAIMLYAQPQPVAGLFDSQAVGRTNLEERLRSTYESLPAGASGLPEASAIRYLAQRFLTAEYGRWVHGLDRVPLHGSRNTTEVALIRSAELLKAPVGLPPADRAALQAVQRSTPGQGFTLGEAAAFVHAIENILANTDMMTMRRAHALAKQMTKGKPSPKLQSVLLTYAALHMSGTEAEDLYVRGMKDSKARVRLEEEIQSTMDKLRYDIAGEPLEQVLMSAERAMTAPSGKRAGNKALEGMRLMRKKLDERQAYECSKFHGVLSKLDADRLGQVEYRTTFGMNMKDWALLETPEYLRAVGALQERSLKGIGPGVLIPNYVTGMNSCRDTSSWHASICCPDECELEILPRLEAAAQGPRLPPKQIWQAIHQPLVATGVPGVTKRSLRGWLRRLAARSHDGKIAVHGRRLGLWLHRAFPHKCRKPVVAGSPLLVDPALSPTAWERAGNHLPLDPPEVAEVRAHLLRRWGKDGKGEKDVTTFAARSNLGLDTEIQLIKHFHEVRKAGGPPVRQQLENFLNVRVMREQPDHILHLSAAFVAAGLLGLAAALLRLAARALVLALSTQAAAACAAGASAAAAGVASAAERAATGAQAASQQAAGAASSIAGGLGSAGAAASSFAAGAASTAGLLAAVPETCARRALEGATGTRAAIGARLAAACRSASAALAAAAASLADMGQELAPASRKRSAVKKPSSASQGAKRTDDDSTDTGETDSGDEVTAEHTSDSELEDPAKQRLVYSKALLLRCRPASERPQAPKAPKAAEPVAEAPRVEEQPEEEEEEEEEEEAEEEEQEREEEAEADEEGGDSEGTPTEVAAADEAPAQLEPQPLSAGGQPAQAPALPFKAPPGLEEPSTPTPAEEKTALPAKQGSLTGLLSSPTSLRPAAPVSLRPSAPTSLRPAAPTSLRPAKPTGAESLLPGGRKLAPAKPEQKSGELSWRSQQPTLPSEGSWRQPAAAKPESPSSEGNWRQPAAGRSELSWRQQSGPSDGGAWRAGGGEPAKSAEDEGCDLLAFVCQQLQTY